LFKKKTLQINLNPLHRATKKAFKTIIGDLEATRSLLHLPALFSALSKKGGQKEKQ
jgi:phosphopantothenate synthetase